MFVVVYRRFGTDYRYHLEGSRSPGPLKMGPRACPETSLNNYQLLCVTTQNSEDFIYTAVEA
jgi:hypothetical protein